MAHGCRVQPAHQPRLLHSLARTDNTAITTHNISLQHSLAHLRCRQQLVAATMPKSYWSNSSKEELVLSFVGNFTRQFRLLYNNRKPLFIVPPNECGVNKFVCTTVRPTLLPYRSLYDHASAAAFVASYLTYEYLDLPTEPPVVLPSPSTVLWNQRGNSFDMAVLLCSLLEGAGR
jgi:hypothetical protein